MQSHHRCLSLSVRANNDNNKNQNTNTCVQCGYRGVLNAVMQNIHFYGCLAGALSYPTESLASFRECR